MEIWDTHRVHAIIKSKRREMESSLGPFVCSGKSIYVLSPIDSSLHFKTIFRGESHLIHIDNTSMVQINLAQSAENVES